MTAPSTDTVLLNLDRNTEYAFHMSSKAEVRLVSFPVWGDKGKEMKTIGFRFRCSCGERGFIHRLQTEAESDMTDHQCEVKTTPDMF